MKFMRRLLLSVVLLAAVVGGGVWWWINQALSLSTDLVELSVEQRNTPREIANAWVKGGVQTSPFLLYEWFRWSGDARKIRAGSYEVARGVTPRELLNKMVRGDESLATVRLIEGWTFKQFRTELSKTDSLKPDTAVMSDADIMTALGEPGVAPEGRFYPDTYAYSKGASDMTVLKRAHHAMQRRLAAVWAEKSPDSPLRSPNDALILASIVEKETGSAADRGKVAGVFANRLRIGMPLQTDPAVIYGMGASYDGNLRKRDLQTDTPFNTYMRDGLPPTPIAMPGKAALMASVKPDATKALYFVSRGDGTSEFSNDLASHNRAVNQFIRGRPVSK